ncbi:uncharacterized protein LOC114755779 [Neltuma alba]|uniref:uncharacterized protein LOC114755779 n=1 Tax=Neltuma alba TaxID=207710 RepID=UPI0010A437C2|nr:uncharacterized protein LOC114755779 [Prosopis alba]
MFDVHEWKCSSDARLYRELVEKERTYEFLLGLIDMFDDVRGRIMGMKPLPSLFETFDMVRCEESRKQLTLSVSALSESLALTIQSNNGPEQRGKKNSKGWCDHCNKNGHTRDICWKLHGKQANLKQKRRPESRGYVATTSENEENGETLSREELQVLKRILEKHNNSTTNPTANLVKSGNSIIALNAMVTSDNTWIVDSGATDHMTGFDNEEEDWYC